MSSLDRSDGTGESVYSTSALERLRRRRQAAQGHGDRYGAELTVDYTPVVTARSARGLQISSSDLTEQQDERLAGICIADRPHGPPIQSANLHYLHPSTTRKDDRRKNLAVQPAAPRQQNSRRAAARTGNYPQASCDSAATTRPRAARVVAATVGDGLRLSSGDLGAARAPTTRPVNARGKGCPRAFQSDLDAPRPRPGTSGISWSPTYQCRSQDFLPISAGQPPIVVTTDTTYLHPGEESGVRRSMIQHHSTRSEIQQARSTHRQITQRGAATTGTGQGPKTTGEIPTSSVRRTQISCIAPTGHLFFPPAIGGEIPLPGYGRSGHRGTRPPADKMGIGIETEFLLRAKQPSPPRSTFAQFAQCIATEHNRYMDGQHPRMLSDVLNYGPRQRFDQWALITDSSMSTHWEPWGIEMITPLFVAFPGSQWRSHVQATWNFLHRYYEIIKDPTCSTHVHVSIEGGYSLEELKRVASCIIHFEPAFNALVPKSRIENCEWAKSNWIDCPQFAAMGLSRAQAILKINSTNDFEAFSTLMQPRAKRRYAWNFRTIIKYYTIEFRKPPGSKTAEEALAWAELAMSFIQTSIRYGSPERLKLVPPTLGGLRWFLRQNHVAGFNEPERLNLIWEDKKDPDLFVEGIPFGFGESAAQSATIMNMIEADRRRILRLIQKTQEPYWDT